jgi:hypothetical protein
MVKELKIVAVVSLVLASPIAVAVCTGPATGQSSPVGDR